MTQGQKPEYPTSERMLEFWTAWKKHGRQGIEEVLKTVVAEQRDNQPESAPEK